MVVVMMIMICNITNDNGNTNGENECNISNDSGDSNDENDMYY